VSNVQITVAEDVDVGSRGGYYDHAGVLRDMFQNHLLQLLSLVAMEPPASLDANAVRNEKAKVLGNIRLIRLGRHRPRPVRGLPRRRTRRPRFADAHLRRAQALHRQLALEGRALSTCAPARPCPPAPAPSSSSSRRRPTSCSASARNKSFTPNMLTICIQPDEGVHLRFETKVPDTIAESRSVKMDFSYRDAFPDIVLPDAYERLLLDALKGDASLFARSDGIEIAWRLIDPILYGWKNAPHISPLRTYAPKTWGPPEADELLAREGHVWRWAAAKGCQDGNSKGNPGMKKSQRISESSASPSWAKT
jgi:glucose-6-phosphate 1-dehydrogenase